MKVFAVIVLIARWWYDLSSSCELCAVKTRNRALKIASSGCSFSAALDYDKLFFSICLGDITYNEATKRAVSSNILRIAKHFSNGTKYAGNKLWFIHIFGKSKTCSTMTWVTTFYAGESHCWNSSRVFQAFFFFIAIGAFSEGLIFVGGAILVLLLVLVAISEVNLSVDFLTNSRLEIQKMQRTHRFKLRWCC